MKPAAAGHHHLLRGMHSDLGTSLGWQNMKSDRRNGPALDFASALQVGDYSEMLHLLGAYVCGINGHFLIRG